MNYSKNITPTFSSYLFNKVNEKYVDFFLTLIFSVLLVFVVNRFLMERLPGWDHFRMDAEFVGRLHVLKEALLQGTIPYITSTYDFGQYSYADLGHYISPLFPGYWLILITSPMVVWAVRLIFLFTIGSYGSYLFVKRYTNNRTYALAVGFFYIFFPSTWTMRYGTAFDSWAYFIPIFLELIVRLSNKDKTAFALFAGVSLLSNSLNLTVISLINNVFTIFFFAFFIHLFEKKSLISSIFFTIKISSLYVLIGAFYIVPLFFLSLEIQETKSYLCHHLGLCSLGNWDFSVLMTYFKTDIIPNLMRRHNPDVPLYTPLFLNISGLLALFFSRICSFPSPTIQLIKTIICMVAVFVVIPFFIMLTPINKLFIFRGQFFIIPFLWLLLSSISFYYFYQYLTSFFQKKLKFSPLWISSNSVWIWGTSILFILCSSLIVFIHFFYSFPLNKMRLVAMISSEALIMLMYSYAVIFKIRNKFLGAHVVVLAMALFAAFGQRVYLEKMYRGSELNRNDTFLKADAEDISQSIKNGYGEYNKDFRRLFVSVPWGYRGRNWQLIAQTALHPLDDVKTLFSWNYASHPYVFILRAGFDKGNIRLLTSFTTISEAVVDTANLIDLMGVKYVVSAHAPISNSAIHIEFISSFYKKTKVQNFHQLDTGALNAEDHGLSGTFYLYEVTNPLKIAYFADSYAVHDRSYIYDLIIKNKIPHPKTVLLEEDPNLSNTSTTSQKSSSLDILVEKDSLISIQTQSNDERMLVLSYLYWPFWRAYVDGVDTKIYRAYGGFMSIKVPQGSHLIRFQYIPWDFYLGFMITLFTIIASLIFSRTSRAKKD
ncbi:MAG: YfhO family protein [Alphaproteobacteria bacterium]|nr:YfhO family protein [Alphaproteobacteria bacterium]